MVKKRFTSSRKEATTRTLDSYLLEGDNYYQDLEDKGKEVLIPSSKHIVFSACDRKEEAMENYDNRGVFSTALLDILEQNRQINYADLFTKVRHEVNGLVKNQKPVLAPMESFDTNTIFLQRDLETNLKGHSIFFADGAWRLDYGAIHGLPTDATSIDKLKIGIFENVADANDGIPTTRFVGAAKIKQVLLKDSILDYDALDDTKSYKGEIQTWPTRMLIKLEGAPELVEKFSEIYQKEPSPFLLIDEKTLSAKYTLLVKENQLLIQLSDNKETLHGIKEVDEITVKYIISILENIEEWERVAKLQNAKTSLENSIELIFEEHKFRGEAKPLSMDDSITIDYPKAGEDKENGELKGIGYTIKVRNTGDRNLYISLLHLGASYSVDSFDLPKELLANANWITLGNLDFVIENPEWNEVTDIFKLLVSTEDFDDYKFDQVGFELNRTISKNEIGGVRLRGIRKNKPESDWCTFTVAINTIRQENSIQAETITFEKEGLKINGHSSFQADVAFAPVRTATRSVHKEAMLANAFRSKGFELINLANSRSVQDKTIIELSGLTNEESLKEQPLEIELLKQLSESEQIIPITFDGDFIIPFGKSIRQDDGSTLIQIDELPAVPDPYRRRSVKKALWFCLLKVTGFRDKAFRLRWAYLNEEEEVIRNEEQDEIQKEVDEASKILLVIHGIIGDTKAMAKSLMYLVDKKEEEKYDMMLTFDYENLNEPIEETAKKLNAKLEALELGPDDDKQLDLIVHSMGGLVSRYMIENLRAGDQLVDRLIMLGTPNGGSPFGSIPEYIELFTSLTSVAINFGKLFSGPLLFYLDILEKINKGLDKTKVLLVTLDQMNMESDFTKALAGNNQKPHADYTVIAGDINQYDPETDQEFFVFINKVLLKIGNTMNKDVPNDIAVAVKKIHAIPERFGAKKYTVKGNHINYFEEGEAMELLRKII